MEEDVFGKALLDYHKGLAEDDIITSLKLYGFRKPIRDMFPLAYLFRTYREMPALEQTALQACRGRVLDIGAGAGSHSLYLQDNGLDVTALDASEGAAETCRQRGLKKVCNADLMAFNGTKFDTVLLLMNGMGIAGSLAELDSFFTKLKSLLKADGQILADSSDIRYMYEGHESSLFQISKEGHYYGEGSFTMEYKGEKGPEFPWLYLDLRNLEEAAKRNGLNCKLVRLGDHYDYLVRLGL